ncbi:tRNA epoxyqueuosine(34) reductase QueG [Pokkaliibacter sp. CJK22405]|uniref:tRNA epoxyqueuosine(34) reductase QueG n=1 Tax=Pokkaliibacter sp. CJK22405 TaxID=3384615 RepID=UPI00398531AE
MPDTHYERTVLSDQELEELLDEIRAWSEELGFQDMGVSSVHLGDHPEAMERWINAGYHGEMDYLERNHELRSHPEQLVAGTLSILSFRMDYLPAETESVKILNSPDKAYISRYALGRDYHKLIRKRLTQLGKRIEERLGAFGYRAFVDSAPVMERPVAEQAGLGWVGKNTLVMNRKAGSWFFLGELFTTLPFKPNEDRHKNHCGKCSACLDLCPTKAFPAPGVLDARRCISYLTIEFNGVIPEELRPLMGNRIYGCDDCQLVCPWNRFAKATREEDFLPRHALDKTKLLTLFQWTEEEFLKYTEGSPIRRTGYANWQRNLSVALGNAPYDAATVKALEQRLELASDVLAEHLHWALNQQLGKKSLL